MATQTSNRPRYPHRYRQAALTATIRGMITTNSNIEHRTRAAIIPTTTAIISSATAVTRTAPPIKGARPLRICVSNCACRQFRSFRLDAQRILSKHIIGPLGPWTDGPKSLGPLIHCWYLLKKSINKIVDLGETLVTRESIRGNVSSECLAWEFYKGAICLKMLKSRFCNIHIVFLGPWP